MSVTGQQVVNRVNAMLNDSANNIWSAAVKLEAINAAIDAAWPELKQVKIDSSITLATATFEYTPTAMDVSQEFGFQQAYANPLSVTAKPKVRLRRVRQRRNGATWTIVVPDDIAGCYNTCTLNLHYLARIPSISALTDAIELPLDYLFNYTTWFLVTSVGMSNPNFDTKPYSDQIQLWFANQQRIKTANARAFMTQDIRTEYDFGETRRVDPTYRGVVRVEF